MRQTIQVNPAITTTTRRRRRRRHHHHIRVAQTGSLSPTSVGTGAQLRSACANSGP
jgi:hypothetical protein